MPHAPNFFAGPFIDRRSDVREDAAALRAIRADPSTRYVVSIGGQQLLHTADRERAARIAFLSGETSIVRTAEERDLVLLGRFQDTWCLSLIHISEPTRQAEISYAVFCSTRNNCLP